MIERCQILLILPFHVWQMLMVRQTDKSRCRGTLRREKTGIYIFFDLFMGIISHLRGLPKIFPPFKNLGIIQPLTHVFPNWAKFKFLTNDLVFRNTCWPFVSFAKAIINLIEKIDLIISPFGGLLKMVQPFNNFTMIPPPPWHPIFSKWAFWLETC